MKVVAEALAADAMLGETLEQDVVDYWINNRKLEWLSFYRQCSDVNALFVVNSHLADKRTEKIVDAIKDNG